jgi:protein-S-isoprenylcysteine O-methyltransferase
VKGKVSAKVKVEAKVNEKEKAIRGSEDTMWNILVALQNKLDYQHCRTVHFCHEKALGRIAQTSAILGFVLGLNLALFSFAVVAVQYEFFSSDCSFTLNTIIQWCCYMTLLCMFHLGEYFITALNQDDDLSDNSFVVNHSTSYTLAALASWFEYWIETILYSYGYYPYCKSITSYWLVGVFFMITGNAIRCYGMMTCGHNFSHQVMTERKNDHQLITTGIYSILRHPSYFGWFYWSIGSQILLMNPICTIVYTGMSWNFFYHRIKYEENYLIKFYGQKYKEYIKKTYIGIPFIQSSNIRRTEN